MFTDPNLLKLYPVKTVSVWLSHSLSGRRLKVPRPSKRFSKRVCHSSCMTASLWSRQTSLGWTPSNGHESMISAISLREFCGTLFPKRALSFKRSVGGGSVMDTAKAANLFTVYKDADLYDFINAPVGKGLPITQPLRPLIAIPVSQSGPI